MTDYPQTSHFVTDWLDERAKLTPDRIALVEDSAEPSSHAPGASVRPSERRAGTGWDES